MAELTVLPSSRYKRTAVYQDSVRNRPVFALMEPVDDLFALGEDYTTHTVTSFDIGFLDRLAYQWYDDSRLWWVIAYANGIVDPELDLRVGQQIVIPTRERVTAFLVRNR